MAFDATKLINLTGMPTGRNLYRYDTTDHPDVVEAAGYMNNVDDVLNLAKGDIIFSTSWSAIDSGTISYVKAFMVTNVIASNAASSAGNVNLAEILISTAGALSSGT